VVSSQPNFFQRRGGERSDGVSSALISDQSKHPVVGGMNMDEVQFFCPACEKEYSGDTSELITECRVCKRIHCSDCVDEYGRCVECAKKEASSKE
jgi:hypothetical protein